ncbi:hypothetical protein XH93_21570 [Bradyrhizobium sp. CCBAU 51753]|nr:hypothetical protein XH93_21570 [Bradyrhizobium sp. CCBAU 51753]
MTFEAGLRTTSAASIWPPLPPVATTCVHDLAARLRRVKCGKAGKWPAAELLQFAPRERTFP